MLKEKKSIPIYYLCPFNCNHDRMNYYLVKGEENVKSFLFPSFKHAATIYPFNFPDFIYLSNRSLDQLEKKFRGKMIDKKIFLLYTISVKGLVSIIFRSGKFFLNNLELRKKWEV